MKNLFSYSASVLFALSTLSCSVDEAINSEDNLPTQELSAVNESSLLNTTTGVLIGNPGQRVTVLLSSQDISGTGSASVKVINNSSGSQIGATAITWTNSDGGEEKDFTFRMPATGEVMIIGKHNSNSLDLDEVAIYIKATGNRYPIIYLTTENPSFP